MKQRIQELSNHRATAVNHKNNINRESYYYNETVTTKHRAYILWINAYPYYKQHTERRFRQGGYDRDIAAANERIINLDSQINSLRQQEEQSRLAAIEQERQQKIAAEKAKLEALKHGNDVILDNQVFWQ